MRLVWFALVALVSTAVLVQASSGGPPASTVVSNDGCTCHSAMPNSGTSVTLSYPTTYLTPSRHEIRVTSTTDVIQNPAGNKGGFLAWVSHGTFAKRSGSEDWYQIESLDGKSVIKHNFNGDSTNTAQEWKFDWIPPSTDVGPVTLKVWVNRVNGDGSNNEFDHWNRKHVTMSAQPHRDPGPTSTTTSPSAPTSNTPTPTSSTIAPTTPVTTTPTSKTSPTAVDGSPEQSTHADPSPSAVAVLLAIAVLAFVVYRRR